MNFNYKKKGLIKIFNFWLILGVTILSNSCASYKAAPLEDFTEDTSLLDEQEI